LLVSTRPATAAGVFTQNRVAAAPVQVSRARVPQAQARAIVVCAGNANACTGVQGLADAEEMTALAGQALQVPAEQVLVASTGVIGRPLPMMALRTGIPAAAAQLSAEAASVSAVAHAIMTTDTQPKVVCRTLSNGGRVTGLAKGAAMIGPNLATMLAFVLTDAALAPAEAQQLLTTATDASFNCVSVEGHTSTNDTVFLLANGAGPVLSAADRGEMEQAVADVCAQLARAIAADAEGAKHLVTLTVAGCADDREARQIAKAIADSALVKTAIYGADPNWGRIVSAAGYAGVPFAEQELSCWLGDRLLYERGTPVPFDAASAADYLRQNRDVRLRVTLERGPGQCVFYTCDLTPEYVRLNADYTT
jgi:glutamate N-acetyltransferase/amino-acid N-acetyltransferase